MDDKERDPFLRELLDGMEKILMADPDYGTSSVFFLMRKGKSVGVLSREEVFFYMLSAGNPITFIVTDNAGNPATTGQVAPMHFSPPQCFEPNQIYLKVTRANKANFEEAWPYVVLEQERLDKRVPIGKRSPRPGRPRGSVSQEVKDLMSECWSIGKDAAKEKYLSEAKDDRATAARRWRRTMGPWLRDSGL